ncbi:MAG: Ig-like domain-containing protein [Pseudomonadota bacterium]
MTHPHRRNTASSVNRLVVISYCLLALGCGGGGGSADPAFQFISMTISMQTTTLMAGESTQLTAMGTYNNNETRNITGEVRWESSNTAVATISNESNHHGLFTALTAGEATVTAVLNSLHASRLVLIEIATWIKYYSVTESSAVECIRQASDGGFVLTGRIQQEEDNWDIYLMKLDAFGTVLWERTFGGTGNDTGKSLVETQDGRYIIVGQLALPDSDADGVVLAVDGNGNPLWQKTFGGPHSDEANAAQTTSDGALIIAGATQLEIETLDSSGAPLIIKKWDACLRKMDMEGTLIWEKTFGEPLDESGPTSKIARSVRQVAAGGFIIAGSDDRQSTFGNFLLIRTDEEGAVLWEKTFGGSLSTEKALDVLETPDGGFLVGGEYHYTGFGPPSLSSIVIKTDASGNEQWKKGYHSSQSTSSAARAIIEAVDGNGYVIAGHAPSPENYNDDISLFKIDENGGLMWEKFYGDQSDNDTGVSIYPTADGGYILAGNSKSGDSERILILKTDENGEIIK